MPGPTLPLACAGCLVVGILVGHAAAPRVDHIVIDRPIVVGLPAPAIRLTTVPGVVRLRDGATISNADLWNTVIVIDDTNNSIDLGVKISGSNFVDAPHDSAFINVCESSKGFNLLGPISIPLRVQQP